MAIGISIGIGVPSGPFGDGGDPTPFFEILAENGDFIISETGAYLIIE
jgi:hypothetical protein